MLEDVFFLIFLLDVKGDIHTHTCNVCAEIRESWPTDILRRLDSLGFFLSDNHEAKAAAIASVTGSVRLTGSPSTPEIATPRISLHNWMLDSAQGLILSCLDQSQIFFFVF